MAKHGVSGGKITDQIVFAGALCCLGMMIGCVPRKRVSWAHWLRGILPLVLVRAADIGFHNAALASVSVALQQIVKSTIPVFVCVLTAIFLQRPESHRVWLSLLPIVGGDMDVPSSWR